ncbi:MAG: hypothetical protein ACM3YE_06320 [Bacteroidota bacterium]
MVQIATDDLLRALKRCKGIAKQELLIKEPAQFNEARKAHAEARREIYAKLIDLVESSDIENACAFAFKEYQSLAESSNDPIIRGRTQALEMFFNVLGIDRNQLSEYKTNQVDIFQLLSAMPQPSTDYCMQ